MVLLFNSELISKVEGVNLNFLFTANGWLTRHEQLRTEANSSHLKGISSAYINHPTFSLASQLQKQHTHTQAQNIRLYT